MPQWFEELSGLLRIQSISAEAAHAADVAKAGEWVCELIRGAGGQSQLIDWHGQPLAIGELRASADAALAPTVLCYGHFDVQPPDPLELWESPPFEPEIRGEYLYGRGVADDKGQLYLLLSAARGLAQAGELPVNVRFICDGEEETGGHSVVEYLQADELGADAAVIFDMGMIRKGLPAFTVATRGIVYFHVTLSAGERDLHSGLYGGAALNAANALVQTLAAVIAADGRLEEPLRKGIIPPTPDELEAWQDLPAGADGLAVQGGRPMDARAREEFYVRTLAEPSLDINGIRTGSPDAVKTVIPSLAVANVSIRLAPGQQAEEIAAEFERLLREAAPSDAVLQVELLTSAPPAVVPADSPAVQLGLDAFERALGVRPVLIRSGGTLPLLAALADRGIPTILTGFFLPDANIHAPNERLLTEYVQLGMDAAKELLQELRTLSGLPPACRGKWDSSRPCPPGQPRAARGEASDGPSAAVFEVINADDPPSTYSWGPPPRQGVAVGAPVRRRPEPLGRAHSRERLLRLGRSYQLSSHHQTRSALRPDGASRSTRPGTTPAPPTARGRVPHGHEQDSRRGPWLPAPRHEWVGGRRAAMDDVSRVLLGNSASQLWLEHCRIRTIGKSPYEHSRAPSCRRGCTVAGRCPTPAVLKARTPQEQASGGYGDAFSPLVDRLLWRRPR